MKKKIIHRSPTQVIFEDGTSKRFKRTPKTEKLAGEPIKIPVRDEDFYGETIGIHGLPMKEEIAQQKKENEIMNRAIDFRIEMDKQEHEYLGKRLVGRHGAKVLKEVWRNKEKEKWLISLILAVVLGVLLGLIASKL